MTLRSLCLLSLLCACTPVLDDDDGGADLPDAEEAFVAPADGLDLEGTLLLPAQGADELVPGIVLVHGSGPSSRDATLSGQLNLAFGFDIHLFAELSIRLRNEGYAVLRYDKRSCGPWGACDNVYPLPGDDLLADAFVDDAVAAMAALGAHGRVDPDRLAVVGHSQGGGFVPHVLDSIGVGGVSLAGNWNPIDDLLVFQAETSRELLEQIGQTEEQIDAALASLDQANLALAALRAGTWGGGPILGVPSAFWGSWMALDDARPALVDALGDRIGAINGDYDWNIPVTELDGWAEAGVSTREVPCVTHAMNCISQPDWTQIVDTDLGRHVSDDVHEALAELLVEVGVAP